MVERYISSSLSLPSLPKSSPLLFPPIPLIPLEVGPYSFQLWVLGERCNLTQQGLGQSPAEVVFGAFRPISLKIYTSGGNSFNDFPKMVTGGHYQVVER